MDFLFKPAFVNDGQAQTLFGGSWEPAERLNLVRHLDYLIIARANASYARNTDLENLTTANLRIELKCFALSEQRSCGQTVVDSTGAGFTNEGAVEIAVERAQSALLASLNGIRS